MNTISELARSLSAPVYKVNLRDPNVFYRERHNERTPESLAFKEAVRFECKAMKAEIRANGLYFVFELKAELSSGSWSINEADQITLTRRIASTPIDIPVFASDAALSPKATEIIYQPAFRHLLKKLDLGARESLHFYKNAVVYYAQPTDAARFLERTTALSRFVAGITNPQNMKPQHVDLPESFADLSDCAQEWAISDETERAALLENASWETLRKLIERVAPRLPSIDEYLSTHSGESDAALGSLAETVSEAQIALQQTKIKC